MQVTRRQFVKGGVAAFTVGFTAPWFMGELARVEAAGGRSLVVLYLGGGNDSLSTVVPYADPYYYARRPTLAVPGGSVLQIGTDASGVPLGLHPGLAGLKGVYDQGRLAILQRVGYADSERSHFRGGDIWATAQPDSPDGPGWIGRWIDLQTKPIDPLIAWNTGSSLPHTLEALSVSIPSISSADGYGFSGPNGGSEESLSSLSAARAIASHVPVNRPHLALVNKSVQAAMETLDRVASVSSYTPSVTYPGNGLGSALETIAAAIATGVGTRVFWVATGGYDTHSNQTPNGGFYAGLMGTLGGALAAFYTDLANQGLLSSTLVLQYSEFARRIDENGSQGTDHGAAGVMLALGGGVQGGLYGTAPDLNPFAGNPTLENNGRDVTYGIDFRSVYARVLDTWLGANSLSVLGGDYRVPSLSFV